MAGVILLIVVIITIVDRVPAGRWPSRLLAYLGAARRWTVGTVVLWGSGHGALGHTVGRRHHSAITFSSGWARGTAHGIRCRLVAIFIWAIAWRNTLGATEGTHGGGRSRLEPSLEMITVTRVGRTNKVARGNHAHRRRRRHARRHVMQVRRKRHGRTVRTRRKVTRRKRRVMPDHARWRRRRREWLSVIVGGRPRGRARAGSGRSRLLINVARVFIRYASSHGERRTMLNGRPRLFGGFLGRMALRAASLGLARLSLVAEALMLALAITLVLERGPATVGLASPFAAGV